MTKRKGVTKLTHIQPIYFAPDGDDQRIEYCESCDDNVTTVPAEDICNQSLRACAYCGSYTEPKP